MTAIPRSVVAAAVLVLAALAVYVNSFGAPFVFDDRAAIIDNPSIRQLWRLDDVLSPPAGGRSVSGRPLVNLSLAFNYHLGGTDPAGYHVFNVIVHALAGLALFGILRRIWPSTTRHGAGWLLPLGVSLWWILHPLQTAAVTYVVQRAETMMGLFYLLTLYAFIRGTQPASDSPGARDREHDVNPPRPGAARRWLALSWAACLAGMATKETMVTAPLVVLLFDRAFMAGSFEAAWRQRRVYYVSLAGTWLLLGWLLVGTDGRGGTVGFAAGLSPWSYLLTQCEAITLYLKLALWPHPLVFDRGEYAVGSFAVVWPEALFVMILLGATVVALRRRPVFGFLAAWFWLVLAPTSSVVPIASQTIAEHRMYLPLAAVIVAVAAGLHRLLGRRAIFPLLIGCIGLGGLTILRNRTYGSEVALWSDTARHAPANARAHANLGNALLDAGRLAEARAAYEQALHLQPGSADLHVNLAHACTRLNQLPEAVAHGEAALRLDPANVDAHLNLAAALLRLGRIDEAAAHQAAAHQLRPELAELGRSLADTHIERMRVLAGQEAWEEAQAQARAALQVAPNYSEAHFAAGNLAAAQEDFARAIEGYQTAVTLDPDHIRARNNLANALLVSGRIEEAIRHYREVLQRRPGDPGVEANLQRALQLEAAQSAPAGN